jgi:hypothetical protein
MASKWFYARDGQRIGSVSSAELQSLAALGKLLRTDLLWKEGMADWRSVSQFPKLFPEDEAGGNLRSRLEVNLAALVWCGGSVAKRPTQQ